MNLNDIFNDIKGVNLNNANLNKRINKISIDSRILKENDLFLCLVGEKFDGHDYIMDAIKKNVAGIIVTKNVVIKTLIPIIKVDNIYNTMEAIAINLKNKYKPITIAITGSNGKTTTKELIASILSTKYKVLKNEGNKNNFIGLTTTLFNLDETIQFCVLEMGMNHACEISKLSKISKPDIGIITNIGTSHIGYLGSKKNIFKAKLEIKDGMNNENLIVNGDDRYLKKIKNSYKCGKNSSNDLVAYNIYSNNDILSFNIYLDKEYQIRFNNPTRHFINDILLAIKVCLMFDIDINSIINRIYEYKMINNRMNIIRINNLNIINDCYNSSFESLIGPLNYLMNIEDNKLIIIGDILELGKYSKKIHKKINKYLKRISNKNVLTVGNNSKYVKGIHFNDNEELIDYLKSSSFKYNYIYIKGSRKLCLEQIVEYFKNSIA